MRQRRARKWAIRRRYLRAELSDEGGRCPLHIGQRYEKAQYDIHHRPDSAQRKEKSAIGQNPNPNNRIRRSEGGERTNRAISRDRGRATAPAMDGGRGNTVRNRTTGGGGPPSADSTNRPTGGGQIGQQKSKSPTRGRKRAEDREDPSRQTEPPAKSGP